MAFWKTDLTHDPGQEHFGARPARIARARQDRQGAQAAVLYDTVERAAAAGDMALLERSATDIEDKFASTTYAHQSALLAARVMFERGNAASARKQLQWVLDHAEGFVCHHVRAVLQPNKEV